ncbi:NifB/NifX family molybdenum-iron cluster-binding protein [Methanoculleus sp. 7T]|jgi:predicted Fe-Mo cluster-binding NifX family protein|uniref:NifB/NifX family molybdenum-iron cluster-binding protein n=1 Tax=Methanoculleus sp. 7T TaxID=2937282 RepID=UPI0020C0435E|nr:NifB/NifX family molybdenum-iron cluster-binding protein [Methanoculleus sp. 7T]MCK8518600.1 NifB/NifX family molybdenum-iron cluster-binding protein [Methanoculleus sp. 7T]
MTVCITARAAGTDAPAEQRFGRAPCFVFIDTETGKSESVENPFTGVAGGVAPRAVQVLSEHGATVLITGQIGGNAARALEAGGIKAYAYRGSGSVADALAAYTAGNLKPL